MWKLHVFFLGVGESFHCIYGMLIMTKDVLIKCLKMTIIIAIGNLQLSSNIFRAQERFLCAELWSAAQSKLIWSISAHIFSQAEKLPHFWSWSSLAGLEICDQDIALNLLSAFFFFFSSFPLPFAIYFLPSVNSLWIFACRETLIKSDLCCHCVASSSGISLSDLLKNIMRYDMYLP